MTMTTSRRSLARIAVLEILEDSERCPSCERYISKEDLPVTPKPWWIIVGVMACLYVVYRWIIPG